MLSEATGMACKSYLLVLALIVMSVCVSAHRPLVENHEAPALSPKSPLINSGDGNLKVESAPPDDGEGKLKVDGSAPPNYGSRKFNVDASEPVPSPRSNGGGGKLKFDSTPTGSLGAIGLIPGIPLVPGGDGSFHFALGPIDFGGNIGWGGVAPGYAVSYSQPQPYVVVSPYTSPVTVYGEPAPVSGYGQPSPAAGYGQPSPAAGYGQPAPAAGYGEPAPVSGYGQPSPVSGYGQPSPVSGYGQPSPVSSSPNPSAPPVTGYGQPSQGYFSPYESARGNAPSSPQNRGSLSNRYN